jgi:hypothetical protein
MRHLSDLAPIEVSLLSCGVVGPTGLGLLIPAACAANRLASPLLGAGVAAVDVPVVAPPAEKEDLATAAAANEAQRLTDVHGSKSARQKLDDEPEPCDEDLVEPPRLGWCDRKARVAARAFALFG